MSDFAPTLFSGRRFAVVGLGRNGAPAARALRTMGAEIVAWDDSEVTRATAKDLPVRDISADDDFNFDALILSPGIPHHFPEPHPIAVRALQTSVPILSDAELLFQAVRQSDSQARFVGVTGTNGKSTTTALLAHILGVAGIPVAAGGNLAPAALSLPLLPHHGVYVLEMSSYMLERLATIRFDCASMLNISPDHIDRHGDLAGYATAKRMIFDRQTTADLAVVGVDDALSRVMAAELGYGTQRIATVSGVAVTAAFRCEDGVLRDDEGALFHMAEAAALPGSHNAQNAAAAAAMALFLGVSRADIARGLASYPGLPHRQQLVATVDRVRFINDSKATNADATERALVCYDRLIWIAGGQAKEGGITSLGPLLPRVKQAFLIGRDAPVLAETLTAHGVAWADVGTLEEAVPAAFQAALAQDTDVVLLSPACASWDQFTGYDQRGETFAELARHLTPTRPVHEGVR